MLFAVIARSYATDFFSIADKQLTAYLSPDVYISRTNTITVYYVRICRWFFFFRRRRNEKEIT